MTTQRAARSAGRGKQWFALLASERLAVAFWRKGDNRARVGLRFYVSRRWASERDVVALTVGLRFNLSRRRSWGRDRVWRRLRLDAHETTTRSDRPPAPANLRLPPVARPSRRNTGTISRDGDRAEGLNGRGDAEEAPAQAAYTLSPLPLHHARIAARIL